MAQFFASTGYSVLIFALSIAFACVFADDRQVYIAYMGSLPKNNYSPLEHQQSILQEVVENRHGRSSIGFPKQKYELHTTRSWDFMGLKENVKRVPKIESDVIVGVIDSGIWPEAESFAGDGLVLPKEMESACVGGKTLRATNHFKLLFNVYSKLIGARFYDSKGLNSGVSARDTQGHGTHTASTAAGNQVTNVSFFGLAQGNARGAVPSARIAVYKVCWEEGCNAEDILSAFDDAISDGVDILSVSLGGQKSDDYSIDPIAIGAFHAMQNGILTSQSAGNNGPEPGSVSSIAPWILSVAASNTDRKIIDKVILGDNTTLVGSAISPFVVKKKLPLVDSYSTALDGKIIFYEAFDYGTDALSYNAGGMIIQDDRDRFQDFCWNYPLPTSLLTSGDAEKVSSYMTSTEPISDVLVNRNPVATISKSEILRDANAPKVVTFSSRGPDTHTPGILKPDITAPGTDILAAWSPVAPPTVSNDVRSVKYNMISGTSMSCPHVTGAAAYVKTFHPDWSPSAIKSALMTTAFPLNATRNPDAEFSYGAGHIDPVKAVNPGLVYDALEGEYIKFLCSIGYTSDKVKHVAGDGSGCPKNFSGSVKDLNYPSIISVAAKANFSRTVTNVGVANSTYKATVTSPSNLKIVVSPSVLAFKTLKEKQSFVVSVSATSQDNEINSASLVWSDGIHIVRSPIVVYLNSTATNVVS
ncbi:hypothetical protein IFM89_027436 [Coptis chinensis]|uniref:Cucumisin n=1 Tax=Coptis chinensis TaxID=261450 RepID=A0A835MDN6_9MAGN|nr:hypothetical protein IFM89_027436 [Coptis chinensis]